MSIASRNRSPPPQLPPLDELPHPMYEHEPPFCGRREINPWRPAFYNQLAGDLAEHEE